VVIGLTTLTLVAVELALPAVLGGAVDALVEDRSAGAWGLACCVLVGVLVICDAFDDLATGAVVARCTAWLRHRLLRHVLALGPRPARGLAAGDVASRIIGNTAEVATAPLDVVRAAGSIVPAVGGTIALALIDPWLCVTFLVGMPALLLIIRAFVRVASERTANYLRVQGTIAARLVDALTGARTIAAAGTAEREARRVLEPLPELHHHGVSVWRAQMRITTQDAILLSLLEVCVLAVAGTLLARGRITPGEMLAASQYVLLAATMGSAASFVAHLATSRAAAARLDAILALEPMLHGTASLPAGPGRLELRGVTVRDGDRTILDGVALVVPGGSMVAVVGASGAGKSLLAALAGRLVDPDEGAVLLDGVPLAELTSDELRRQISFGFERPALIGATLADAIGFGGEDRSAEEVAAAATLAEADGFIRRMPDGYATRLADAPMSGGEAQRIGLARAFAGAGRLVVLDDVAASLDSVTEHRIGEVLTSALADRTRIVVAHRASTAARADAVVWLDDAGIRALAPHRTLWRRRSYRALFEPGEHGLAGAGVTGAETGRT
jgi:ATP-binding cassette subfamily B protein